MENFKVSYFKHYRTESQGREHILSFCSMENAFMGQCTYKHFFFLPSLILKNAQVNQKLITLTH